MDEVRIGQQDAVARKELAYLFRASIFLVVTHQTSDLIAIHRFTIWELKSPISLITLKRIILIFDQLIGRIHRYYVLICCFRLKYREITSNALAIASHRNIDHNINVRIVKSL